MNFVITYAYKTRRFDSYTCIINNIHMMSKKKLLETLSTHWPDQEQIKEPYP